MIDFFLFFFLLYRGFLSMRRAAYDIVPPYLGTSHLGANIVGLDLNSYPNPLITANFGVPFYLGFVSIGLIATSLIVNDIVEKRKMSAQRGVAAIFTTDPQ